MEGSERGSSSAERTTWWSWTASIRTRTGNITGATNHCGKSCAANYQTLTIEYGWTDGQSERLSALAAELVGRHVPVIVSSSLNATYAAKAATSTIPVVFAVNNDPVATGLVASLNRPGGNLTGVAYLTGELGAKRLGLMHEIVPKVADFAVLAHPTYPTSAPFISDVEAAARDAQERRAGPLCRRRPARVDQPSSHQHHRARCDEATRVL
jgi:ABC-type uncharacterized transport system substrate-binding protein